MNDSTIDQLDYADQTNYYAGPFCDCGDASCPGAFTDTCPYAHLNP